MIVKLSDLYILFGIFTVLVGALLAYLTLKIKTVVHETSPNSGGSMKDKVNLTYELLLKVENHQSEWRLEQTRHNDRLYEADKRIHARLDEHIHDHIGGTA